MPTTETPVETPPLNGLAPLATSAELAAARTSHLAGFKPDSDPAKEVDGEPVPELPPMKFPRSIRTTLELMEEMRKESATTARDQKLKDLKLRALAEHLHCLQQVPTPKPLTAAQHAALAGTQTNHAKSLRLEDLARQFPEVKEVLDENARLTGNNQDLSDEISKLNAKIAELTPNQPDAGPPSP